MERPSFRIPFNWKDSMSRWTSPEQTDTGAPPRNEERKVETGAAEARLPVQR